MDEIITRSILYHYPIPFFANSNGGDYEIKWDNSYPIVVQEMIDVANEHVTSFKLSFKNPSVGMFGNLKLDKLTLSKPEYYSTEVNGMTNVINFIIDQAVKMADVVSSDPNQDTVEKFNYIHYRHNIVNPSDIIRPPHYDSRYEVQCHEADMLSQEKMSVFVAQPGFGKTGTGLHYILSNKMENRKAYWVCPRNSIAESVYKTLTKEIENRRLSDKIQTALLLTNDWKIGDADADIIVTNIDNFLRPVLKNDAIDRTFNMLNAVCIFDEFHEYVGMNTPLMAMFDLILKARWIANCRTLLLSATPIMNFPALIVLQSETPNAVRSHNDPLLDERVYDVKYGEVNDLTDKPKDTLIQFNSRAAAQDCCRSKVKHLSHLIHSQFLTTDRDRIFEKLLSLHGKGCDNPDGYNCIATNIISTGVDISLQDLVINLPSPDGLIQSLGRCNRWNDSKEHTLTITNTLKYGGERGAIEAIFGRTDIYTAFHKFLKENLPAGQHTFREIREVREKFYEEYKGMYQDYFSTALQSSYRRLRDIIYEFSFKGDGDITDEMFVGNNILRSNGDISNFWCQLYYINGTPCKKLYQGDTLGLGIDTEGKDREKAKTLADFHFEKIRENSELSRYQRKSFQKKEATAALQIYIAQARSDKYPLHIPPSVCYYDTKFGIVKVKKTK